MEDEEYYIRGFYMPGIYIMLFIPILLIIIGLSTGFNSLAATINKSKENGTYNNEHEVSYITYIIFISLFSMVELYFVFYLYKNYRKWSEKDKLNEVHEGVI